MFLLAAAQPLVNARPAVEMAAAGDHRLHGQVQADVAVEASAAARRRRHVPARYLGWITADLIHLALAPSAIPGAARRRRGRIIYKRQKSAREKQQPTEQTLTNSI
jgi:hypothetical protein